MLTIDIHCVIVIYKTVTSLEKIYTLPINKLSCSPQSLILSSYNSIVNQHFLMTIKGAIAAGHKETAKAAEEILIDGGNAFDAAIAAQFTACVAEPVLCSLGGGGFLLADPDGGPKRVYDYFVQTPLNSENENIDFKSIIADFGFAKQEFHIGAGSIATPGMVKGLFAVYDDLCSLPMKRLIEPAVNLARRGVEINAFQGEVFDIIKPIYLSTEQSRSVFGREEHPGMLKGVGDVQKLTKFADFLESIALEGEDLFYRGEVAAKVDTLSRDMGGFLTRDDFESYRVAKRKPLHLSHLNRDIYLNPPPSSGGILIAFAMKLLSSLSPAHRPQNDVEWSLIISLLQEATEKARVDMMVRNPDSDAAKILDIDSVNTYKREILDKKESFRGTTHISIIDGKGNIASLTLSNGEGSGLLVPGTEIMLNNMLGEEDLNPDGFHRWQPNSRMTSMMTPGIAIDKSDGIIAFGSGGSTRIRTAILQLLIHIFDRGLDLESAVMEPRLHAESGFLHLEQGLAKTVVLALKKNYPNHRCWDKKSLFFGGTHVAEKIGKTFKAVGDPRRGGVSIIL